MGCDLHLEDERGAQLADLPDPRDYVGWAVGLASASPTVCLRFIDPYGDTVFNRGQAPVLIQELVMARDLVTESAIAKLAEARFGTTWQHDAQLRQLSASAVKAHIDKMLDLARRCEAEPHLYLKFYGD
jgi:hypothetical protein